MLPSTESIFTDYENLKIRVSGLELQTQRDQERIQHYESENNHLREMLAELKRMQFGKKSERWESSEQLVFNEAEVESRKLDPLGEDDEVEIKVSGHTKRRGHRRPLPENLEREEVIIELPELERFAEDGTPLKIIGYELSEKLSYEPSKTKVIVYRRAKYGVDSGDYVKTAEPVPSIIERDCHS
jgi:hypothetical protein